MTRAFERAAMLGDVRDLEKAEAECFPDPWPGRFFAAEMVAPARFCRVLVGPAGEVLAYLFCVWQYLDLHVLKVATRPAYRRQGFGRRLMESAERHVEEQAGESMTLEVRRSNDAARAMYRRLGFEEVGLRVRYYSDREDAVVMTRRCGDMMGMHHETAR
jgi:ribosomal-protein-alanine N-acetyltransferase